MNVDELIQRIEKRPGMFVGNENLEAISHFIGGFLYSRITSDKMSYVDIAFKEQFHEWVKNTLEQNFAIQFDEERDYVYYITEVCKDDQERAKVFFELCADFFDEVRGRSN